MPYHGDDGRLWESEEEERRVLAMEDAAPGMLAALKLVDRVYGTQIDQRIATAVRAAIAKAGEG